MGWLGCKTSAQQKYNIYPKYLDGHAIANCVEQINLFMPSIL